MAIVPLFKATLLGPIDQKENVLDGLQELGCLHLLSLTEQLETNPISPDISAETRQALKFLRACPVHRRPAKEGIGFDFEHIVQEALRIEHRQQQLQEEHDNLKLAIQVWRPWGDVRLPEEGEFGDLRLWFYVLPHYRVSVLEDRDLIWEVVSEDHRFAYVVVLSPEAPDDMPLPPVQLDRRPLSELRLLLEDVEAEQETLYWERVALTRWLDRLSQRIALAHDQASWQQAARQTWNDTALFALRGWIPESQSDRLKTFAAEHSLALTLERPTPVDSPPTLLENQGVPAGGQEAVTFYTTPAYHAWDPSAVVFVSFSVFFAMIMADAGYALLLGGLVFAFRRRLEESESRLRLRRLLTTVVILSLMYGIAIGSYFGFQPDKLSLLGQLQILDPAETTLMMQISLAVGVIHLVIANLALAWIRRWSAVMLSSLGWVAILVGGLVWGLGQSRPELAWTQFGVSAILAGLFGVLLFSSHRPLWTLDWRQHGGRFVEGLMALTGVTRAFGDVLSYLRLFALGLASAQLAATFNDLSYQVSGHAKVGSLLAVLVIVLGHGLNFLLAIMSGVVHGLRLNCIEFFGWGLPDEGYPFQPFCKKAAE